MICQNLKFLNSVHIAHISLYYIGAYPADCVIYIELNKRFIRANKYPFEPIDFVIQINL